MSGEREGWGLERASTPETTNADELPGVSQEGEAVDGVKGAGEVSGLGGHGDGVEPGVQVQ